MYPELSDMLLNLYFGFETLVRSNETFKIRHVLTLLAVQSHQQLDLFYFLKHVNYLAQFPLLL